jgi:diguanylate cyclase (GGDEF)-like protein
MKNTLKNFIFSTNALLLTLLLTIIFAFTTYLHTSLAKEEAYKHADAVSKQVFASMYQVMKKGWSTEELNDFSESLKKSFDNSSYSINIYRSQKVTDLFGARHQVLNDSLLREVLSSGKPLRTTENHKIRNIQPLIAKQECLTCHTNVKSGDTLGAIDVEQNIINIINETLLEYVYFFLAIIPLVMLITYFISIYTTKKINTALIAFNEKVSHINTIREFKDFDITEVDLKFDEFNNIIQNINILTNKLKSIAVDKDILEFEVQLLDKFIITSEIVKDWKEVIHELLNDINQIMHTYTLMTMFRIGDDQFEVDVFWHGIPSKKIEGELEKFIKKSIDQNQHFENLSELKIVHSITNYNICIQDLVIEDIQHQTKSLFLDTPKIGGIVGISVQADIVKDPIKNIVIDSILTTMANLVGSVKAINKYTNDLEYYAAHDPLTGLLNQRIFIDMMEYEIKRAKRHKYPFGLMMIDCDNFKPINDRYGHAFGDQFLQAFAKLLADTKREEDILSRYGGDEFTIILPECDINGAVAISNRISKTVEDFSITTPDGTQIGVTASIGIAIYPDHSITQKELFVIADSMMYKAKEEGKNAVRVPQDYEILSILKEQKEKSSMLLEAISNNNIVPYFQPIQSVDDSGIVIHELLMRIVIDNKLMSAYEFIEIAEQMSLITKMDLMVIENAFKKIHDENYTGYIFINLSPKSLIVGDFVNKVIELVHMYGVEKSNIIFEITERETVKNFSVLDKFVQNLKFEGFKFAIDDFGSGFSSFHYIKKFPIDFLKIDGEFIVNINKDEKDRAFVQSIVTLAQMLKVKTVAEFVEDDEIVQTLKEIGIDFMQGYHIGKPSPDFMK